MLKYLIVDMFKGIPQAVAEEEMIRSAPLDDQGNFLADKERDYNGIHAAFNFKEKEFETIAVGERFNKVPTRVGEEYAVTELEGGASMAAGTALAVSGKKFAAGEGNWEFVEVYANPYGLEMYRIRRVK